MNHHEEREEHEGKEFDTLSRQVIGCAIEVHRFLGPGLLSTPKPFQERVRALGKAAR